MTARLGRDGPIVPTFAGVLVLAADLFNSVGRKQFLAKSGQPDFWTRGRRPLTSVKGKAGAGKAGLP